MAVYRVTKELFACGKDGTTYQNCGCQPGDVQRFNNNDGLVVEEYKLGKSERHVGDVDRLSVGLEEMLQPSKSSVSHGVFLILLEHSSSIEKSSVQLQPEIYKGTSVQNDKI